MISSLIVAALLCVAQVGPGAGADGQAEVDALVERIRSGLARVDETLLGALDANDPAASIEAARQVHRDVIRDLEELIAQAKYQRGNQGGGGGGGSSGGGGGDQSQRQQQQQQQQSRESDGSATRDQQQGGEQPQPDQGEQGQQPESPGQGEQQDKAEGQSQPTAGDADNSPGGDKDGPPPPPDAKTNPLTATGDERWGLLPPKLQERLVNLHVDDVPPRYRDWLSAYIRAMRKVEAQEGP